MAVYQVIFMTAIGALIGWFTNYLAIKMLFHPLYPLTIPVVNYRIIGLIPKRRAELAKKIGDVVQDELVSVEEILDKLIENQQKDELVEHIKFKISKIVSERLPGILSAFKSVVVKYIDDIVETEFDKFFSEINRDFLKKVSQRVDVSRMVEEKINQFDIRELEEIIIKVANKELRGIIVLGGVLGLVIGFIQAILLVYF
ncbi:DUF445 domain-containing protein [Caldanaerobius polysaccharolyticus]|uniref:DUF445 domain-containing protein n=1 Tax=Caldanaerobius polysaccharolyticus TaxID=44256 RepID=UPI00047C293A|nr:DUF445 family protein [Caldanaerobius polysaccharolyticus]